MIGRNRNAAWTEYHRQNGAELITGPLNPSHLVNPWAGKKGSGKNRRDRGSTCTIELSRWRTNQSLGIHPRRFARFRFVLCERIGVRCGTKRFDDPVAAQRWKLSSAEPRPCSGVTTMSPLEEDHHGLFERRLAVAAGRAAADHSADRLVLAPLGATRQKAPQRGLFVAGTGQNGREPCVPRKAQLADKTVAIASHRLPTIRRID
jgi:hypothetical protein